MHNLIVGSNNVDHQNNDGLDNWRANLRSCTNAQNQQNTAARGGSSRVKGVSWYKRHRKWRVAFNWNGASYFVGYFPDEVEAARAYNVAIFPQAGEFARLNEVWIALFFSHFDQYQLGPNSVETVEKRDSRGETGIADLSTIPWKQDFPQVSARKYVRFDVIHIHPKASPLDPLK